MLSFLGVKYSENLIRKATVVIVIIMTKDMDVQRFKLFKAIHSDVAGCQTSFEMNPGHYITHPHPNYK